MAFGIGVYSYQGLESNNNELVLWLSGRLFGNLSRFGE